MTINPEKTVIGKRGSGKLAYLSKIFKIEDVKLDKEKILALSMLFSLLNSGNHSLLYEMKKVVHELYYFQAIPIFRGNGIYLQLLTSCSVEDTTLIENNIKNVFESFSNLSSDELKRAAANVEFQQNLLFDGVEKSIMSFANMPLEQENIVELSSINTEVLDKKLKKIIGNILKQEGNTVIAYI
ncbi:hypothetical protein J2Z60_001923 [Lactobacillus colini]|uniref:Peptidase M16 C-terminal domain-containing protein n=1 Tax=Lactobacillus colini TaxID=1819254 RepID=A0ABS4MGB9_9LACO|nr:hypothetical protein [Lactobacillus colini]MBP2058734.1 hypothetical protein [Lactobacillus colini]